MLVKHSLCMYVFSLSMTAAAADSDICSTLGQQPVTRVKCGTNETDRERYRGVK